MSDDYNTIISSLITTRDAVAADLASSVTSLAGITVAPSYSESGDGGSQNIDLVGLRAQLMSEIKEKTEAIKQLNITIASMSAGINVKRVSTGRRFRWWC